MAPDGVFLSNSRATPKPSRARTPRWSSCWKVPVFGICLGHR
ncbi:MAG: glutamine amidotransferase-related protein [Eggerthella lenta]